MAKKAAPKKSEETVSKKVENELSPISEVLEREGLTTLIECTESDIDKGEKQISAFFDKAHKVYAKQGGLQAVLNTFCSSLKFSSNVIDPLFKFKQKIISMNDDLIVKRKMCVDKIESIEEVKKLNAEIARIDGARSILRMTTEIIDGYCLRQLEDMRKVGTKSIKSFTGKVFKYRENPPTLTIEKDGESKLPHDCRTEYLVLNEQNRDIILAVLKEAKLKADLKYEVTSEQKKILKARLIEQKKAIDLYEKSTEQERLDKNLTEIPEKDLIKGAYISSSIGLDGNMNDLKLGE